MIFLHQRSADKAFKRPDIFIAQRKKSHNANLLALNRKNKNRFIIYHNADLFMSHTIENCSIAPNSINCTKQKKIKQLLLATLFRGAPVAFAEFGP